MKKGFTLIELLIIMSIVGILLSILAPPIAKYFEEKPSRPIASERGLR